MCAVDDRLTTLIGFLPPQSNERRALNIYPQVRVAGIAPAVVIGQVVRERDTAARSQRLCRVRVVCTATLFSLQSNCNAITPRRLSL